MLLPTDFIWALAVYILLIAFRDRVISFARTRHVALSPFFAASFNECLTFSSSR